MSADPSERMTGYDVARYQKDVLAHVGRIVSDIELRKWCVLQAIAGGPDGSGAQEIYDFVTNQVPKDAPE